MNIRYPIYEGVYRILTYELRKGKEQTFLNRWRRYAINLEESDIDR